MNYAEEYGALHANQKTMQGYTICNYVAPIRQLIDAYNPLSLLDYGCGKGHQYLVRRVHEEWGGLLPHCYDIGVHGLSGRPVGLFKGVLCVDVAEHIEEPDVPAFFDDVLSYVQPGGFAFIAVSTRPAKKTFPDGRNLHRTVADEAFWLHMIAQAKTRRAHSVQIVTAFENRHAD